MWVHELTFPSFRLIICLIQVCLGGKGCSRQAWCSAHPFAAWFQHLPSGQFQVVHVTIIRTIKNYMPWWSLFAVLTSKLLRTMPYVGTTQKSNGNNTSRVQGWLSTESGGGKMPLTQPPFCQTVEQLWSAFYRVPQRISQKNWIPVAHIRNTLWQAPFIDCYPIQINCPHPRASLRCCF